MKRLAPGVLQRHYTDASGKRQLGPRLHIRYYANGKRVQEPTPFVGATKTNIRKAERLRHKKMDKADAGEPVGPQLRKTRFAQLDEAVTLHYELNNLRSWDAARHRLKNLRAYFGDCRLYSITTKRTKDYAWHRRNQGAANGTINREASILRLGFKLLREDGLVARVPKVPRLEEASPREGFILENDFHTLCDVMGERHPEHVGFLRVLYWSGWRWESTVMQLRWAHLDGDGWLTAPGLLTKNKKAVRRKVFAIKNGKRVWNGALGEAIRDQRAYVDQVERRTGTIIPWMFCYPDGRRVKNPTDAFNRAKIRAGFPELILHDFCRAAWQNGIDAGVPEKDLMDAFGRKTRSIADRYNITTTERLAAVDERLASTVSAAPPRKVKSL